MLFLSVSWISWLLWSDKTKEFRLRKFQLERWDYFISFCFERKKKYMVLMKLFCSYKIAFLSICFDPVAVNCSLDLIDLNQKNILFSLSLIIAFNFYFSIKKYHEKKYFVNIWHSKMTIYLDGYYYCTEWNNPFSIFYVHLRNKMSKTFDLHIQIFSFSTSIDFQM